jgi:hypothetical protein
MPATIVTTKDGDKILITEAVKDVDFKAGTPDIPAQPAVEAKPADPGVPADPVTGLGGRPPTPAVEAKDAVEAKAGTPSVTTFTTDGGSIEVEGLTLQGAADMLNRG